MGTEAGLYSLFDGACCFFSANSPPMSALRSPMFISVVGEPLGLSRSLWIACRLKPRSVVELFLRKG